MEQIIKSVQSGKGQTVLGGFFLLACCHLCCALSSAHADWSSIEAYYQELSSGCESDQDCIAKNVGNCCGKYPRCVLKVSKPDTAWVQTFCSAQGLAGVCGYPKISGCVCKAAKCQELLDSGAEVVW